MRKIYFPDTVDILNPCRDAVFKLLFGGNSPQSNFALGSLVSAFIGRKTRVLKVIANEPPVFNPADRQIRYDVACALEDGEPANLEMTLCPRNSEAARMEYHIARLYANQDIRSAKKGYGDLKQAYQISFFAEENFFRDEEMTHHFKYYDERCGTSLGGRTEIIAIELKKADAFLGKAVGEMSHSEQWALFFRYGPDREKRPLINEILNVAEGIAVAGTELLTVSEDERRRAWLMSAEKYELDVMTEKYEARCAGMAEGLAEGYKEAEAEYQERIRQVEEQNRRLEEELHRLHGG